ncbi:Dbl homology domain-containing protein [Atractiella rhizophila]|nr:Dbl homology domain-containing protein [Atractiella rhizophila]
MVVADDDDEDLVFVRPPSKYETFPSPSRFRNLAKRVPARRRKHSDDSIHQISPSISKSSISSISSSGFLIKRKRSKIDEDDSLTSSPTATIPEIQLTEVEEAVEGHGERAEERIANAYTKYRQLLKELPPTPTRPSSSGSSSSKVKNWFNSVGSKSGSSSHSGSPMGTPNSSKLRITPIEVRRTSESSVSSLGSTWSSRVGSEILETVPNDERKRQEAIFELLNTEQTYLRSLQQLMEVFFVQLRPILPAEVSEIVFGRVDEILLFNTSFLSELEERQKADALHVQQIGDVIENHIEGIEVYRGYCVNQANAAMLLETLKRNDAVIKEKLETLTVDQLKLEHYLLAPFQRVTRYKILFEAIFRYTPEDHPDRERLQAAIRHTEAVLNSINEDKKELEEDETVARISRTFLWEKGFEPLDFTLPTRLLGKRRLVKEMHLVTGKSRRKLKGHIFNDCLLFSVPRDNGKEKVYWGPLALEDISIRPVDQTNTFSMEIVPSN